MKAVQISKPRGNFEVVERPIPQTARGQVHIKYDQMIGGRARFRVTMS